MLENRIDDRVRFTWRVHGAMSGSIVQAKQTGSGLDAFRRAADCDPHMTIYQISNGTHEQRDDVFKKTAIQLNMPAPIVETDFWVCWCLKQLFTLPTFGDHTIFKGGTSLSKAYDVNHRFSEDVDLYLTGKCLALKEIRSGKRRLVRKKAEEITARNAECCRGSCCWTCLTELQNIFEINLKQDFSLTIDKNDAQTLLFSYPLLK